MKHKKARVRVRALFIYKERARARMFREKSKMRSHFGLRGLSVLAT